MSTSTAQLLAEIPLFSTIDDEERRQLRAIMRERSFRPGQVVMAASDLEASSHSPRCFGNQRWEIGSIEG